MSHQEYSVDKLSQRLPSLLPEYLRDESPMFEAFLNAYFEYLEAEILTFTVSEKDELELSDIDGILNEDSTGSMLLETGTISPSPDQDSSKILLDGLAGQLPFKSPYKVGEYIVGKTSKTVAKITVINNKTLYIQTISGTGFAKGEIIVGREGSRETIVSTYKENSILANNRLLDYSDIDHTTEEFLDYFQKDLAPSFDLGLTMNKRLTIKNIKDLYQQKGTEDSLKFLMRLIYGQDAEVRYPYNETIFASDSNYSQKRRVNIKMSRLGNVPVATDKIIEYSDAAKTGITAESVIESVFVLDINLDEYSLEITDNHKGTFTAGATVDLVDRDGITIETATIQGLVHSINHDASATYVSVDSEDGMMVLEDGEAVLQEDDSYILQEAVEFDLLWEDGGGVLLEGGSAGSMYSNADKINFVGAKDDTDTVEAVATVSGLSLGGVTKVFIEDGGTNYEGGEMVVFDNTFTGGSGATAVLGSVGDEVVLENHETFGQYEFIATAGQTLFNGNDIHGKSLFFNDNIIQVFKNGLLKVPNDSHNVYDYSHKNDRVVFTDGLNAGDVVEIVIEYFRVVYEDGRVINYNTTDGRIREVLITDGGAGYHTLPKAYPGGFIFVNSVSGFVVGELITGQTSSATAKILEIDSRLNRITVMRDSTHTGIFVDAELILGGTSTETEIILNNNVATGAGAKLFSYSPTIGAIEQLNILDQGNKFNSDAVASPTSTFPMMVTTPTGTLGVGVKIVGDISRASAIVQTYDQDRHILKYTNLKGSFLPNERVAFGNVDSFTVMIDTPYNGRGTYGGEGVIQEQFLGDKSWLDASAANIHDNHRYQSHSYVVRVGESINKWRSVVKDLLHPAGHIFFGEVAIHNTVKSTDVGYTLDGDSTETRGRWSAEVLNLENAMGILSTTFVPMVIMQLHPTDNVLLETSDRNSEDHMALEDGLANDHDLYTTSSIHLLENENSRDNFAHTSKETKRIIQNYMTDYMVLETAIDGQIYEEHAVCLENGLAPDHDDYVENGFKVINELSRPESKVTDARFIAPARVNNPILHYKDAGSPTSDGVFDTDTLRVTAIQDSDGDGSNDSEAIVITDPVQKSTRLQQRHVNITRIVSKSEPLTRKTTRIDTNIKYANVVVTAVSGKYVMDIADAAGAIQIQQGYQYFFTTPKAHPLKFSTTSDGTHNGGVHYTTGVINYTHNNSADLYNMTQLIVDGSTPTTLYYYCTSHSGMGGKASKVAPTFDTVLSLYPTDQYGDHVEISGIGGNMNSSVLDIDGNIISLPTRTSLDGKVQTSIQTLSGEGLLLEDGSKIVQEQVHNFMRTEPTHAQNTAAEEGDVFQFEDNDSMELEDATITREEEYFITERTQSYARAEQNYGFGTTLRRLNMLSSQQTYDISYYIKDESDDGVILEDGTGNVMVETPKYEGIRINEFETYFPRRYSDEYEKSFANKRTNLTYSAYVKSG